MKLSFGNQQTRRVKSRMRKADAPCELVAGRDKNTQEGPSYVTSAVRQWQGEVDPLCALFAVCMFHLLFDLRLAAVFLARVLAQSAVRHQK